MQQILATIWSQNVVVPTDRSTSTDVMGTYFPTSNGASSTTSSVSTEFSPTYISV